MRTIVLAFLVLAACSVPPADGDPDAAPASDLLPGFTPPAPGDGEIRIVSPIIHDLAPGTDVTLCSYLPATASFAVTSDIVQANGYTSALGSHHALLALAARDRPVDTHACTDDDMTNSRFLAGVGGGDAGGGAFDIPAGIAFRVDGGRQLLVQTHWINSTDHAIDGQVAFIVRVQPPSSSVQPAQLLNWGTSQISIPAGADGSAHGECPVGRDLHVFIVGGHAHEWGTHVTLAVNAAAPFYDQAWTPHDTFDPPRTHYDVASPMELHAGDVLTADCTYHNSTGATLEFPREMCIGFAFFFPGDAEVDCLDGSWPSGS